MGIGNGKLLGGDSGRKIAEVIDLQGAIYHGGCQKKKSDSGIYIHIYILDITYMYVCVYTHTNISIPLEKGIVKNKKNIAAKARKIYKEKRERETS